MNSHVILTRWCLGATAVLFAVAAAGAEKDTAAKRARELLELSGVQGGILVHLGCGEGVVTAALGSGECRTVHGLEADAAAVVAARRHIRSLGRYGRVSVEHFTGSVLPYADNVINLVVVDAPGRVSREDVMRVLVPGGVACVRRGTTYEKAVKPWPPAIDEWSHFLHDASNNAVARDTTVGPPRCLQWVAPPLWLRSHETPSGVQASVTAGGRLFYIFDEGLVGITDERLPDRWSLVCRDAFNGRLLWKRPLGAWGWREWSQSRFEGKDWTTLRGARTSVPDENQRRLVAGADRLYVTLAYRAPLSILDAATGETVTTVEETRGTSEILVADGVAVAYKTTEPDAAARRRGKQPAAAGAALVAVDPAAGRVLWQKDVSPIRSLNWAIEGGRIIAVTGKRLVAYDLTDGRSLWTVEPAWTGARTLVLADGVIVMQGGNRVAAHDAANGALLWEKKKVLPIRGAEAADLFVVGGLVWRGMASVDEAGKPVGKSANALVIGWDLRTGEEKRRVLVKSLRSPEHHHRCYRNKATTRYLISSFEGAEFLDFAGSDHGQHNWLRGACKYGMMPANGLLYVPSDQCFCQPGAKLLGFAALKAAQAAPLAPVSDANRLEKGEAYGAVGAGEAAAGDWPTFRHDPARSGSTRIAVSDPVAMQWQVELGGTLTAPVAAQGRVFVAQSDAHTVHALDMASGEQLWHFTANGRVDSPPTVYRGLVVFGSRDGYCYCLRAEDGRLVWRFLAAPVDWRIGSFDQLESAWPVHGSVLIHDGVAYFTAGRSTYLDGGIRLYGLDPATGAIRHTGRLEGPHPRVPRERDLAFFIPGANSDVLVSEGGSIYMRQKKLTPDLKEINVDVLSSKGAQDVGLHLFSTAGLLDGSWYNRTFWMYAKRWPGFQLANQASKTGQLLVVDDEKTYAVRAFYRRNVHSPMFFPGRQGYLLFADLNTNEPQIVGEKGSRKPVAWLPQSDYSRARGNQMRALGSEAFGLDKMIGYTRAEPPVWKRWLPVRIRAMVKAGDTVFVAGPPDVFDEDDPYAAFEGRAGGRLVAVSAADGAKRSEMRLKHPPVFDGMIAAAGRLVVCLHDGSVVCLRGRQPR
jgi:outer membrane protein assembly factor BamB